LYLFDDLSRLPGELHRGLLPADREEIFRRCEISEMPKSEREIETQAEDVSRLACQWHERSGAFSRGSFAEAVLIEVSEKSRRRTSPARR
jgi:hypothetical protein